MESKNQYDYIIAGTGCAGLSLAYQLSISQIKFKKILLVDKVEKNKNDRTWCFWHKVENNWYEEICAKSWDSFIFESETDETTYTIKPYQYSLIKGIDFYNFCINKLKQDSRFEFKFGQIQSLSSKNNIAELKIENEIFQAPIIFNSAIRIKENNSKKIDYVQHFKGWLIQTDEDRFSNLNPTFMDFKTEQENDCRFFYVIPQSANTALIEYTGFSPKALDKEYYDEKLKSYIKNKLKIINYKIIETEYGEIPMTDNNFENPFGDLIINIGTAGGQSKPSTGYTFYFIQKKCKEIVSNLEEGKKINRVPRKQKYNLYDKIFLKVLSDKKLRASKLFTILFEKNKTEDLLSFLNEESTIAQDLKIMNSVPKTIFTKAALKKIFS